MIDDKKPSKVKPATSAQELSGMPEFVKAIKGLAQVPKQEMDDSMAAKGGKKNSNQRS